jgi:hypothetical protein
VSHYQAIANRVASPDARELARQLSSWHDRMVAHDRLTRALRQSCDDECPHAESIELWQMAQQLLGDFAEDLTFLRTTAAHADSTEEGAEQPERLRSLAGSPQ